MNYVVGDIQGCYQGLKKLLKIIKFNPNQDTLWAVGDLVARGEDSLSTLELLYDLGSNFKTVLGNHDLHLLSIINGIKPVKPQDKLDPLLASNDIEQYANWLRQFPLATMINKHNLLTHAGLFPEWSFKKAIRLSTEIESKLQSNDYTDFLMKMYQNTPDTWDNTKKSSLRLTFSVNALTRMRYLNKRNQLDFKEKNSPLQTPSKFIPWYEINNPHMLPEQRIIFGHWASLNGRTNQPNKIALDTGYVWGGHLTCLCLETKKLIKIKE